VSGQRRERERERERESEKFFGGGEDFGRGKREECFVACLSNAPHICGVSD